MVFFSVARIGQEWSDLDFQKGGNLMNSQSRLIRISAVFVWALLVIDVSHAFAADKCETFHANAWGTSTQMGKIFPVKFWFCKPSTPEQRQILVDAFKKGKNQGLTSALEKMPSAGRISTPGQVGYDIAYYRVVPTATGHQIRFVTNRLLAFGELYHGTRSLDYSLTAGQIDVNDKDKTKTTGMLYPAAELKFKKKTNELIWETRMFPWKLQNFLDFGEGQPE
jgi:hypothetical protein